MDGFYFFSRKKPAIPLTTDALTTEALSLGTPPQALRYRNDRIDSEIVPDHAERFLLPFRIQAAILQEQRLQTWTHLLHQRVEQHGRTDPQLLETDRQRPVRLNLLQSTRLHKAVASRMSHR